MEREIEHELDEWKERPSRKPLLLRGARQVGKTYSVRQFAKRHFKNLVEINFELSPEYKKCFEFLDPHKIINLIHSMSSEVISEGKTLLFLDEIQDCPRAIMALRYFKEMMPKLHVIGAGSLLEFALNSAEFRMPVGRVEFLYQKPLSFRSFLKVIGYKALQERLDQVTLADPLEPVLHDKLLGLVKEYLVVGGMPESIASYIEAKKLAECQRVQSAILATYRSDFGKYAKDVLHKYLQSVFDKVPYLATKHFKYVKVDREMRSRDIKQAVSLLCDAGFLHKVCLSSAGGLPLIALMDDSKFKLLMLDVGLMTQASHMSSDILFAQDVLRVNEGAISQQFVGQELLAYGEKSVEAKLFFWKKEKKSSSAEVDYLTTFGSKMIPIEVKSGGAGKLKSLQVFMSQHKCPLGIRISQKPLTLEGNVLSLPFYMISQLSRFI